MFTLIENLEDLNFLNLELLNKPFVAVDTEFRRTSKDNMKLSLMQLNDGEETYIVDCILIKTPGDSCGFLFSKEITKIFHSCKEDIDAINNWTNKRQALNNLYDTQLANAFLGGSFSIGYQDLVFETLGVMIDKKETRSNWIKRPLRDSQLAYAASDVEFLLELYKSQIDQLKNQKKLTWIKEELDLMISGISKELEDQMCSRSSMKINKEEKKSLLNDCNRIVLEVAKSSAINPTLLFSKRHQKEFFELVMYMGPNEAFKFISKWRKDLLFSPLSFLFKKISFNK